MAVFTESLTLLSLNPFEVITLLCLSLPPDARDTLMILEELWWCQLLLWNLLFVLSPSLPLLLGNLHARAWRISSSSSISQSCLAQNTHFFCLSLYVMYVMLHLCREREKKECKCVGLSTKSFALMMMIIQRLLWLGSDRKAFFMLWYITVQIRRPLFSFLQFQKQNTELGFRLSTLSLTLPEDENMRQLWLPSTWLQSHVERSNIWRQIGWEIFKDDMWL